MHAPGSSAPPGSAPDTPTPALDARALATLAQLDPSGNARLIERVLTSFLETSEALRTSFVAGWREQQLKEVFNVAHTFKSSAAIVGALPFSALSGAIEKAVRLDDRKLLPELVERFEPALDDALRAVRARLEVGQ